MRAAGFALAAFLFAAFPSASAAPQRPGQATPGFKSGVQLLEVDARVFDRDGRFVTDLTLDDFEILEDNRPQSIETMFLVGGPQAAGASGDGAAPPRALPRSPQTWIFVFDDRHLMPSGYARAKRALDTFMTGRFRAGDLAGVVSNDKMVNNRISSVREEFQRALEKLKIPGEKAARNADRVEADVTGGSGEAGETIREILSKEVGREAIRAARRTGEMLSELARGLAAMPGPKTVVLMSDGFPLSELEGTTRSIVGQMNRAGARIYAIDTRGLAGGPSDTLNSLAVDTGGQVLFNENNIGRAFDTIADDTNTYYVLGYQPSNPKYDGKYRKIEVRVKRQDVSVRARRGYLALQPSKMLIPQPVK
jgi:VWFA-related protein